MRWGFGVLPFLGGLAMLLFWALVIGLVVWLVVRLVRSGSFRSLQNTPPQQNAPSAPSVQADPVLETLRRRLAAGEITSQEFDELRQKLGV